MLYGLLEALHDPINAIRHFFLLSCQYLAMTLVSVLNPAISLSEKLSRSPFDKIAKR